MPIKSTPLRSNGKTCYVNAGIQILYQIIVQNNDLPAHEHQNYDHPRCGPCKLLATLREMMVAAVTQVPYEPQHIHEMIRNLSAAGRGYDLSVDRQCDAFEFLSFISDRCNLNVFQRNYRTVNTETGSIVNTGDGEAFLLTLVGDDVGIKSSQELLDNYLENGCNQRKEELLFGPNILWIVLNRFADGTQRGRQIGSKLPDKVEPSDELVVDIVDDGVFRTIEMYDLIGTINHIGGTIRQGHYVTYLRDGNVWHTMDNVQVHILKDTFDLSEPCMLFYRKREVNQANFIDKLDIKLLPEVSSNSSKVPPHEIPSMREPMDTIASLKDEDIVNVIPLASYDELPPNAVPITKSEDITMTNIEYDQMLPGIPLILRNEELPNLALSDDSDAEQLPPSGISTAGFEDLSLSEMNSSSDDENPSTVTPSTSSEYLPSSQIPSTSYSTQAPSFTTRPTLVLNTLEIATKREVTTIMGISKNWSAMRMWQFVMFLPKRPARTNMTFKEKFTNLGKNLSGGVDLVLYSISYKCSKFLIKLLMDDYLAKEYEAYCMDLVKGVGFPKINTWLASLFMGHILHSRYVPERNGVKFEIIFDWKPNCLVTRILKQEYMTARAYGLNLACILKEDNLFCVENCNVSCCIDQRPHHLNLMNMQPVEFFEDSLPSILDHVYLRLTLDLDPEHPFYPLFDYEPEEVDFSEIEESFLEVIEQLDHQSHQWKKAVVYCFLIVTPQDGSRATATDLQQHYEQGTATFQTYAGIATSVDDLEAGYRVSHFDSGSKSSVYKALRRNSTIYNFFSVIHDRVRATQIEAAWIEVLRGIKTRCQFLHEFEKNEVLNKRRERTAFFGTDDSLEYNVELLLNDKQKIFDFEGATEESLTQDLDIVGNYTIDDSMEVMIHDTVREALPRVNE